MVIMVPRNLAWGLSSTGGGRGWKQDIFETSLNWTSRGREEANFLQHPILSLRIGLEENRPVVTICVSNISASMQCSRSTKQNDRVSLCQYWVDEERLTTAVGFCKVSQSSANKTVHHYPTVANTCKNFARDMRITAGTTLWGQYSRFQTHSDVF